MQKPESLSTVRIVQWTALLAFFAAWEAAVRFNPGAVFFFGKPTKIVGYFVDKAFDGSLAVDIGFTLSEVVVGFFVGNVIGAAIGMGLWSWPFAFKVSRPFIVVLGSAPIFALAPLLIVWFGTGITSKIMMVVLSTVFVALFQAYTGASTVPNDYLRLMKSFGASKRQVFSKVIAPSALVWVMSAFRMNVGFAILGAFIGEFISSTHGIGHMILVASGLFNISLVLCGVFTLVMIALVMNWAVEDLERRLRPLIVRYL
jgi:NitT/TauT family transport system permease protein